MTPRLFYPSEHNFNIEHSAPTAFQKIIPPRCLQNAKLQSLRKQHIRLQGFDLVSDVENNDLLVHEAGVSAKARRR